MNEDLPKKPAEATPFQRFTIRLIDGKFVRVPKAELPSMEAGGQKVVSDPSEVREMFRLVNGRFTRILDLEVDKGLRIGQTLPSREAKKPTQGADAKAARPKKD